MTRYVTIARAPRAWANDCDEYTAERPTVVVWEPERGPVDTGIVDQAGIAIYRVQDVVDVGFRGSKP